MNRILVLNTSDDVLEALRTVLELEGYEVQTGFVRKLRLGEVTVEEVLKKGADLIIFDLAPPYEVNWRYFQDVFFQHPAVRDIPIVLTSTNTHALGEVAPGARPLELMLKPFDLHELLRRVKAGLPTKH